MGTPQSSDGVNFPVLGSSSCGPVYQARKEMSKLHFAPVMVRISVLYGIFFLFQSLGQLIHAFS